MKTVITRLISSLVILAACSGDDKDPNITDTTNSTGSATTTATATDGMTSTTAGTTGGTDTTGTATAATTSPTTATSSTAGTDSGETDTTGCTFLCTKEDGGGGDIGCDVWAQDCPAGEKCNAYSNDGGEWNSLKCAPVNPAPNTVGEPCTVEGNAVSGIDSCELGAMCWNVNAETNEGVCVALCEGTEEACSVMGNNCCDPGSACSITNGGVLTLCLQTCDPIIQDCMGAGEVCYPVQNGFQCAPDVSGEMGVIGDPCEYINVCDPGTFCGNPAAYPGCDPMAGGCCIPFCELDAPECVAMTECQPWYDPMDVPPGYENLGACVIPS